LAEAALQNAVRLRPDAGETHLAQAEYLYRCQLKYDRARVELALAARTLPNSSRVYELTGYIDRRQGRWGGSDWQSGKGGATRPAKCCRVGPNC
jgi:cytochrome c-type biogenesis protein CcmH/NrfG